MRRGQEDGIQMRQRYTSQRNERGGNPDGVDADTKNAPAAFREVGLSILIVSGLVLRVFVRTEEDSQRLPQLWQMLLSLQRRHWAN